MRRNNTRSGAKYKIKPIETRGQQPKESRVQKSFWKEHTMDEAMTWSEAELEEKINAFYEAFEARQIKINPRWWYPDDPRHRIIDLRYKK